MVTTLKRNCHIQTSGLLFEFQMSEHSEARAKLECVCVSRVGVHQEGGKYISNEQIRCVSTLQCGPM